MFYNGKNKREDFKDETKENESDPFLDVYLGYGTCRTVVLEYGKSMV